MAVQVKNLKAKAPPQAPTLETTKVQSLIDAPTAPTAPTAPAVCETPQPKVFRRYMRGGSLYASYHSSEKQAILASIEVRPDKGNLEKQTREYAVSQLEITVPDTVTREELLFLACKHIKARGSLGDATRILFADTFFLATESEKYSPVYDWRGEPKVVNNQVKHCRLLHVTHVPWSVAVGNELNSEDEPKTRESKVDPETRETFKQVKAQAPERRALLNALTNAFAAGDYVKGAEIQQQLQAYDATVKVQETVA